MRFTLFFGAMIVGCSGGDFETAGAVEDTSVDSAVVDTGAAIDSSSIDSSSIDSTSADSTEVDSNSLDSAKSDTAVGMDAKPDVIVVSDAPMGACEPYWCGCGTCNPQDITCTKTPPGCPLGCASGCLAESMPGICSTVGDRCVRNGIEGSVACYRTADCPPGNCCKTSPPARGVCVTSPDPDCAP